MASTSNASALPATKEVPDGHTGQPQAPHPVAYGTGDESHRRQRGAVIQHFLIWCAQDSVARQQSRSKPTKNNFRVTKLKQNMSTNQKRKLPWWSVQYTVFSFWPLSKQPLLFQKYRLHNAFESSLHQLSVFEICSCLVHLSLESHTLPLVCNL